MLNERGATWKLALPTGPTTSVLILGGADVVVHSLSRNFTQVSTEPDLDGHYDVVIVPEDYPRKAALATVDRHLAPQGEVVTFSSRLTRELCRRNGLRVVRRYGALPAENPRLYFPLDSHAQRGRSLEFHTPGRPVARLAMSLAVLLSRAGFRGHLSRWQMAVLARPETDRAAGTLAGWLSERSGRTVEGLALYAGSDTAQRKMTVRALCRRSEEDFVCKIADTGAGGEAILREGDALERLAGSAVARHIPRVLFQESWQGYFLQAQTLGRRRRRNMGRLTTAHLQFLGELARLETGEVPLAESPYWQEGMNHEMTDTTVAPAVVKAARAYCRSRKLGQVRIPIHRVHGDFASWNIHETKEGLFVYDWEESHTQGNAWLECFHFLVRQASLVGPWPGVASVLGSVQAAVGAMVDRERAMPISWQDLMIPWLVWESRQRQSRHVTDLLEALLP